MGRLGGFRYREIVKRLKAFGFEFHRQAAGSHEESPTDVNQGFRQTVFDSGNRRAVAEYQIAS